MRMTEGHNCAGKASEAASIIQLDFSSMEWEDY